MEEVVSEFEQIEHIDQETIECDLRSFVRWLNRMADRVNWLTNVYIDLKKQVEINKEDIRKLKIRMGDVENRCTNLENRMDVVEGDVYNIKLDLAEMAGVIQQINNRVDMLYSWLPIPYGMIDPKGWKFAMGNISVMSDTNQNPSIDGAGIFTRGAIGDNDVYFN